MSPAQCRKVSVPRALHNGQGTFSCRMRRAGPEPDDCPEPRVLSSDRPKRRKGHLDVACLHIPREAGPPPRAQETCEGKRRAPGPKGWRAHNL